MKSEAKRIENYIDDISGEKEKKKVIAIKKIKFNKKKVLIGVGVAAIVFCTVFGVGLVYNAHIASTMVDNAKAWHHAGLVDQMHLHAENVKQSLKISNLIGNNVNYNDATGIWTIDGCELGEYAKKSMHVALGFAPIYFGAAFGTAVKVFKDGFGLKGIKYRSIVKEIDKLSEELYFTGINDDIRNKYLSLFDYVVENKFLSNKEKEILLNMIKNKLNFIKSQESYASLGDYKIKKRTI